jgi:hypothetical protein
MSRKFAIYPPNERRGKFAIALYLMKVFQTKRRYFHREEVKDA